MQGELRVVKVSSGSAPRLVAGAIAGMLREGHRVNVRAIGERAVANAALSVAQASRFLKVEGKRVFCRVSTSRTELSQGRMGTVVVFTVYSRPYQEHQVNR